MDLVLEEVESFEGLGCCAGVEGDGECDSAVRVGWDEDGVGEGGPGFEEGTGWTGGYL